MRQDWVNWRFIVLEIGGSEYHLNGRESARMKVRIRDAFTCQSCNEQRTPRQAKERRLKLFDVHHLHGQCGKKSKGYDKIEDLTGLVTLCHKCHFNHHQFSKEGKEKMNRIAVTSMRNIQIAEDAKTMIASDIARKHGITRERVRQILQKMGVKAYRPHKKDKHSKPRPATLNCFCGKKIETSQNRAKFCSKRCYDIDVRKRNPEYGRQKSKQWYKKYKDLPGFREYITQRNKGMKGISVHDFVKLHETQGTI